MTKMNAEPGSPKLSTLVRRGRGRKMNIKQRKVFENWFDVAYLIMVFVGYFLTTSVVVYSISYFLGE